MGPKIEQNIETFLENIYTKPAQGNPSMLGPGPRLLGAGALQELPLASVNESILLLISEKQHAFRAYRTASMQV